MGLLNDPIFLRFDFPFLIIFTIGIILFLYKNRKSLKREMKIGFLYKTQWGVKLINYIGSRYKRILGFLQYIIIGLGYFLMVGILYIIIRSVYIYIRHAKEITEVIKAPPIAPLIPYFPELFGLESILPPFYFTYFIISFAIVAIVHEFSHGIFMRFHKIRIKSTGFFFLGPFLGAFVEQNEKDMVKASKKAQLSVLGAGVFANVVFGILFGLLWAWVFILTFAPSGAEFGTYLNNGVKIDSITMVGGIPVENPTSQQIADLIKNNQVSIDLVREINDIEINFTRVIADNIPYYLPVDPFKESSEVGDFEYFLLYFDLPAINAGLKGTIIEVDGQTVNSRKELNKVMENYLPGDEITIKTRYNKEILEYDITLGEIDIEGVRGKPLIGVANKNPSINMVDFLEIIVFRFKEPFTEYKVKSVFGEFMYYLLFWIVLINLLVALFNMLPVTILDGGRFFYLTILGITKNEKIAKSAYKWIGIIILLGFLLMMLGYVFGIVS